MSHLLQNVVSCVPLTKLPAARDPGRRTSTCLVRGVVVVEDAAMLGCIVRFGAFVTLPPHDRLLREVADRFAFQALDRTRQAPRIAVSRMISTSTARASAG